jgi:outer membrane lipoprotein-sorting protein
MWKARSVALSTVAVLMLSLISGSASANPISTNLKACDSASNTLCLEKVELSIDGGTNWVSLGQISSQYFSGTYDLANTGIALENPNANALLVQIDHIQVAGSATETISNNIQVWAYGIDRNQSMTFASMPISG